jgi:hypothetical protein
MVPWKLNYGGSNGLTAVERPSNAGGSRAILLDREKSNEFNRLAARRR